MSKYEFDLSVGISEVLDADSAKKVNKQVSEQKKKLEEPIELTLSINDAKKRFQELESEAQKLQRSLKKAVSAQNFGDISKYTKQMENIQREQEELLLIIGEQTQATIRQADAIQMADSIERRRKKTIQDTTSATEKAVSTMKKQLDAIKQIDRAEKELSGTVEKQLKLSKKRFDDGRVVPQTYTAANGKYEIEKGTVGWNLYEVDDKGRTEFITAYETLNDIRKDSTLIAEQEVRAQKKASDSLSNAQIKITQELTTLSNAYEEMSHRAGRTAKFAKQYGVVFQEVQSGALSAEDAIKRLNIEIDKYNAGKVSDKQVRTIEQVNTELDREKEKLSQIEEQQKRNDAAQVALQKKRENYSQELGSDKPVYDTDKLKSAANGLREFNTELDKRNKFVERYNQLCGIIEQSYVGPYSISNGLDKNLVDFINRNSDMRELSQLVEGGIKGVPTKHISGLFRSVVNSLKNEGREVGQLISSGDVLGAPVTAQLEEEEIRLGKEKQRLHGEYQLQLKKVNDLKDESLELTRQIGQVEKKNTESSQVGTNRLEQQSNDVQRLTSSYDGLADAVKRYVDISKRLWDAYDSGESFSELGKERNSAIVGISKYFPKQSSVVSPTFLQDGYEMYLQSSEMSRQFARQGAEETLRHIEGQLNHVYQEIEAARQAEMDSKLKFSDGTILDEKEVAAVEKYCAVLKKQMGETYDEAMALKNALDLVFNIKHGNVGELMDRFHAGNKASNETLKLLTGMGVNNQKNRDTALRSINPEAYDKIIAEQIEAAKKELESQKSDFQKQWDELASVMLGGDAFKDESNLVKGKILKALSGYGKAAKDVIEEINKAWLKGDLDGKILDNKWAQSYVDHLNSTQEFYDSMRDAKAGDLDIDALFGGSTDRLTDEKAQAQREQVAAWDELISKKKEYYGISSTVAAEIQNGTETQGITEQNKALISSYQDLYSVLEKVVDLSKQLKPEWTAEFSEMQAIMDKESLADSKESLIADIKAQYDNIKRIKTSIKNGLSVYKYTDGSGYEAEYDIGGNTLKDAETTLRAYIYQAIEYFGYTVEDVMGDFDKKRVRAFMEDRINEYLGVRDKNDKYQVDAEAFNAPIKESIESMVSAITHMAIDASQSTKVSDLLSDLQNRPQDVNRYTLSSQANSIGSLIGVTTPYDEIQANAKKIESYEELCDVVARYNELQKDSIIFGGTEYPGLDEAAEMERELLKSRLEATGGKDIYKLSGFNGFEDVDKLATKLGIEVPKAIDSAVAKERELLDSAQGVTREINDQRDAAEGAAGAIRNQKDAEEDLRDETGLDNGEDANEKVRIIQKTVDDALAQLRNAKNNKNLMIDLSDVYSPGDLNNQIGGLVQSALGADLSVGKVVVAEDIARVSLYNDQLGITTQQIWQLKKATEDATEAQLEFVKADPLVVDLKKSQKYIEAQRSTLNKEQNWINTQLSKLNTQERAYKYSGKKIDGSSLIENFDGTVPEEYIGKSLDELTANIRQRLQDSIGGSITEEFKSGILNDLRILENEIKVKQYQQYASTTMSPTEISEARQQFEYMLDSLEAKAKKNNVFSQMEESFKSLRSRLTDENVENYVSKGSDVSNFVDSLRTVRAELNAAISGEGVAKKEQQDLQNALNLQERLYKAKKEYAALETKGELDSSKGMETKRHIEDLERQYQAAEKLLKSDESRAALAQQKIQLERELGKVIEEQQQRVIEKEEKDADTSKTNSAKEYYQTILDTMNRINAIDSELVDLGKKNKTGVYDGLINQLKEEKGKLIGVIQDTMQEANDAFGNGIISEDSVISGARFFNDQDVSNLNSFLQSVQAQGILTTAEIDNLSAAFRQSEKIGRDAMNAIANSLMNVQNAAKNVFEFGNNGTVTGSKYGLGMGGNAYKNALNAYGEYQNELFKLSQQDGIGSNTAALEEAEKRFLQYANALGVAIQKEREYFAGREKYIKGSSMNSLIPIDDESINNMNKMRQKEQELKDAAQEFAKESGASGAIVTKFVQDANGISKLDFSILDEGTNSVRKFKMEMDSAGNIYMPIETTVNNFESKILSAQKQLEHITSVMNTAQGAGIDDSGLQRLISVRNALNAELTKPGGANETVISKLIMESKVAVSEVEKLIKKHEELEYAILSGKAKSIGTIDTNGNIYKQMTDSMSKFVSESGGANEKILGFNAITNQLKFSMIGADGAVHKFTASVDDLGNRIVLQENSVEQYKTKWEQFSTGLSSAAKKLSVALFGYNVFYRMISEVRKGYGYVKEIDKAMTELKKVTDETTASYNRFLDTASKRAGEIGSTVSDFTEATANFARLGYTMEESASMAETAIVYKNVADGLDSVEESTDSIISTMKAFGIESDDTMSIVDRFNEVGNNFAITSAGIGEALQRSASALYESGNTIDESIALVTAANSVIQNPEQVGTALKTLALRLRGAKVELEEAGLETDKMAETTSQLQAKLNALTHGKVDIMLDADTFKSTTQILREMSEVWDEMTDIERAGALELMGGKRQANILASVIKNFDTVESVIETSMGSQGSAMAENEKYLDSIQGKTDQLTNSMQTLWNNTLSSEFMKSLLDILNTIVKIIDKVGLLQTAMAGFLSYKAFRAKSGGLFEIFRLFSYSKDAGFGLNQSSLFTGFGKLFDKSKVDGFAQSVSNVGNAAKGAAAGVQTLYSAQTVQGATSMAAAAQNTIDSAAEKNVGTSAVEAASGVQTLDAAQDAQGASAAGAAVKNTVVSGTQTAVGTTATAASIGVNLLNAALTMGLSLLATAVISGIMKLINDATHRTENLKQEVEELKNTYKDAKKTFSQNIETLTTSSDTKLYATLQDEFAALAAGVDKYGNNISLTSDQYERYKEICEQIVGINPKIAEGYDDATKAIGNNVSVLSQLIELQKIQQRQAINDLFTDENIGKVASDHFNNIKQYKSDNPLPYGNAKSEFGVSFANAIKDLDNYTIFEALGFDGYDWFDYSGAAADSTYAQNFALDFCEQIIEDLESSESVLRQYLATSEINELLDIASQYYANIDEYQQTIDESRNGFIDLLLQVPFGEEVYYGMNDASKNMLVEWIKNSEMFKIDPNATEEEMRAQLESNVELIRSIVGKFADDGIQSIFDEFNNLDTSSMSAKDYSSSLGNIINEFFTAIGGEENVFGFTKKDIEGMFGFSYDIAEEFLKELGVVQNYFDTNKIDINLSEYFNFSTMTQDELNSFLGIDWNAIGYENVKSVQDVWNIIRGEMNKQRNAGIGTYSSLSSSADSYDSVQQQTDEILHNGIQVTQEYKDALVELGISEQELAACFDENNPLIVKNHAALKDLVDQTRYNAAQNVKLAKSQARLKYVNLSKELNRLVGKYDNLTGAEKAAISSIMSQIDTVETAIYKYTILEDSLLGVHNAFKKFEEGKEVDSLNTYGDSYVEMVQTIYDAHTKTGEYGTEAYQAAVDALIDPSRLAGLEKGSNAYHMAIREILNNELVPTLTLDDDSLSLDFAAVEKFVQENLGGLFTGTSTLDFDLAEGMNLEEAVRLTGMTETQLYAMLAALKDFTGVDYLSMLDDSTEGQIVRVNQELVELNRQKLELLQSGNTDGLDEINSKIAELTGNLALLKQQAHDKVTDYEFGAGLMNQLSQISDMSTTTGAELSKIKSAFTSEYGKEGESDFETVMKVSLDEASAQQVYDYLLLKQAEIEEPTVVTVQYAIEYNESKINYLETQLSQIDGTDKEIEINGELMNASEIQAEIDNLKAQNEAWEIRYNVPDEETVLESFDKIQTYTFRNKTVNVGISGYESVYTSLQNIAAAIKAIEDTALEIGAKITVIGGNSDIDGTAHILGTAFKNGSWGAPRTETALVGELGPELLVRGNQWRTIGDNGAEFTNIRKGDIIFNHKQTEDLLSKGYISGRGRRVGGAFASGTAYNNTASSLTPPTGSSTDNSGGNGSGNNSGNEDEFEEIFDWFEVLLEEINEQLDLMNAKLENAVGIGAKGSLIDQLLNTDHYKLSKLAEGIKLYSDYAAKLLQEVPAQYRAMAQDGSVAITEFLGEANEETVEAINNYREWAQKVADLNQQLEETKTEIADLAKQKFDVVVDEYDNIISILEAQRDQFDAQISLMEDRGYVAAKIYYESMIQNTRKQSGELEKQKKAMQSVLDEQVRLGNIKVGSEQWYEMIEALYDVDSSIKDCVADLEEYQNAINDIYWDNFDNLITRLDYLKEETQSLIDLMDSEDMVVTPETEDGWSADQVEWSKEGLASLGLYAQQMEIAEYTAKQYAEAIDDLNADFKAGKYSESEYQEKLEELTSAQYDSIEAYYDAQEAIKDLNKTRVDSIKEGIEKEIEAYEKLIEKKKEELSADKDLYDFEKSVADQQKNISDIERKIAALSADGSISAMAKRKQLEAELAEARASLEESYHDRSVTDQQNALDKELENYKEEKDAEIEKLEEYLENVEAVVADSLNIIQGNASGIYDTLNAKAEEYNLTLSNSIVSPWQDGMLAVSDYQTAFDTAMSSTTDQLEAMKRKWQELIDKMAKAAQVEINSQQKENNRYVEATPVPTVSNQPTSKAIVIGGKINAGSALIYADSYGAGASTQYYSSDPIYTVLEEQGGYVLVRHHSLSSGYSGWFKKSDVRGYAKGTTGTKSDELAWIDELGDELVMHADGSGRLSFLTKGTAVIPHDISENLMELGQLDPSDVLSRNTPSISMSPSVTTNNMEINMQIAEVVHIDTVSNDTIPNLTKAIEKQMDQYMKNINSNIRKYAR